MLKADKPPEHTGKAARRARQEWEQTFDAVPDLITIIDTGHVITSVNKAMAERCGRAPDDLIGRTCHEVMHGSSAPHADCPHVMMLRDGVGQCGQVEEALVGGVFDVTVSPLFDDDGQIRGCVHVARDVTERNRRERELVEAKRTLQATLDAIPDLLFVVGLDGCYHEFHSPRTDLLAAPVESFIGRKVTDILPPDAADVCMSAIREAHETGNSFGRQFQLQLPQGPHWFELSVSRMSSAATPDQRFIVLSRDISERKRDEDVLRESKLLYRSLLESVPAVIYRFSTKTGGLFYSPQIEDVFGYPLQAFYDDPLLWKNSIHPEDVQLVERSIAELFAGSQPGFDIEYRVANRDGEWIWLRDSTIQREISDGEMVIFGLAQNITKLKQAEEKRQALENQFQQTQKLESLGVLAGGIAHDFNNILTIILGHCHIVMGDIDSGMDQKNHVKEIAEAASRAANLCRQMLSYAGNTALEQSDINLWLLVDENVKMLRSAINKNVTIKLDLTRRMPLITGDSAQIQQVVMNLVINAAEAIGDTNGTITILLDRITVSTVQPETDFAGTAIAVGDYACLTVSDDGCGMSTETRRRIFEPFYTTKFTGRGLGMSAVLGIINSHRGALQVSTKSGAGTTFKVYFPLTNVPDTLPPPQTPAFQPAEKCSGTVLLVDDEHNLRVLGAILLKAIGFTVITVCNGLEALEEFHTRGSGIDLVLMDMLMPEMSGREAYRLLREQSAFIPIIICSGCDENVIEDFLEDDPCAAVIQKPYRPEELQTTLTRLLKQYRELPIK
ncbi:MAG: PAS domain-containing protein [Desulfuromonadales bacterium]